MIRRHIILLLFFCALPVVGHGGDIAGEIESLCASISAGNVGACIAEQNMSMVQIQNLMNGVEPEGANVTASATAVPDYMKVMDCLSASTMKNGLVNYAAAMKCVGSDYQAYTL